MHFFRFKMSEKKKSTSSFQKIPEKTDHVFILACIIAILNGFAEPALFDFDVSMHIPKKLINVHIPNIHIYLVFADFCRQFDVI